MRCFNTVFLFLLCAYGCSTPSVQMANEQIAKIQYKPTSLSDEVQNYWVSDLQTNIDSDHVMIILQGGPREYLYFVKDGRTLSRYLPGYKDMHAVYLHQSQTYNTTVFHAGLEFSIEDAQVEARVTTEMLSKAIDYFKEHGKKVTVVGHSYGAFIINDYLSLYTSNADLYLVSAGRLDVNQELVDDNLNGYTSGFDVDGLTYIPFSNKDFSEYDDYERGAYHVRGLLKGAYGIPRYSKKLAGADLGNVYYITGKADAQVGVMTTAEIDLLESRGAKVLLVEGGHSDVYKRMIDAVVDGEIIYNESNN